MTARREVGKAGKGSGGGRRARGASGPLLVFGSRRRNRLKKLRAGVHTLTVARHVSIAAAATRYAVIGLGGAARALCGAICATKNAPVGVVAVSGVAEAAAAEAVAAEAPAPLRPRVDLAAEMVRMHGRLIKQCDTWQAPLCARACCSACRGVCTG